MSVQEAPAIAADRVSCGYGEVQILHEVSVHVSPGEIVTVIGPNGAGKSTLLKAMFGLLPVTHGRITLRGADVTGRAPEQMVRSGAGFVPQTDNVFPRLSVRENLQMGAYTEPDGVDDRISEVLVHFPALVTRLQVPAGKLSGGQRQMLAIARALMLDPQLLLLDEPSASLAPHMVDDVFATIQRINALGTAIVLVEQNARQALAISDRGYVLAAGRNRGEGAAESLLASDDVRRLYLGE